VPAQGPGQAKAATQVRRSLLLDGLAKSFYAQSVDLEHSPQFCRLTFKSSPRSLEILLPVVHARPYIEKYHPSFAVNFLRALADFPEKRPSPD
jgi:hypothetical protein